VTWTTWYTLLASSTALCASIGACIVTSRLSRRSRSTSAEKLSERLTEAVQVQEDHSRELSLIRQRLNQQAYRERKAAKSGSLGASVGQFSTVPEAERQAQERAEMNRRLANGEFSPGGR